MCVTPPAYGALQRNLMQFALMLDLKKNSLSLVGRVSGNQGLYVKRNSAPTYSASTKLERPLQEFAQGGMIPSVISRGSRNVPGRQWRELLRGSFRDYG